MSKRDAGQDCYPIQSPQQPKQRFSAALRDVTLKVTASAGGETPKDLEEWDHARPLSLDYSRIIIVSNWVSFSSTRVSHPFTVSGNFSSVSALQLNTSHHTMRFD